MTESQRQPVPRHDDGERSTATAFLGFARDCLIKKLDGLNEEQARRVLVPSETSLLGLIQHAIVGERYWFAHHLLGEFPAADWDFTMEVPADVATDELLASYRAAIEASNRNIARVKELDALTALPVGDHRQTLRWTIAHMTSETARHAGHADIIRELIDGVTGR